MSKAIKFDMKRKNCYETNAILCSDSIFENEKLNEWRFDRLRKIELVLFIIEVLCYFSTILYFELKFGYNFSETNKNFILNLNTMYFAMKVILIILKHVARKNNYEINKKLSENVLISDHPKSPFLDLFFTLFFQNPFFEKIETTIELPCAYPQISYYYTINDVIGVINMFNKLFAFRYLKSYSLFDNILGHKITKRIKCENKLLFVMRCLLKNNPCSTLIAIFVIIIFNFAYFIRIFEYNNPITDFTNYYNCIWYVCVTMTTIGFGDYTVIGILGRFTSFILAILGLLLINLITVVLSKHLAMNYGEEKVFELYNSFLIRRRIRHYLCKSMVYVFKVKKYQYKNTGLINDMLASFYLKKLYIAYRKYWKYKQLLHKKETCHPFDYEYKLENIISFSNINTKNSNNINSTMDAMKKHLKIGFNSLT